MKNKTIIILVTIIVLLAGILGIKILSGPDESNNIQETSEFDNLVTNSQAEEQTEEIINENKIVTNETNNYTKYDSGKAIDKTLNSKDLILGIIDIIVILVVVPIILRKYNLMTCVIIMVIYNLIITLIAGTLIPLGFTWIIIKIIINFIYYYLFLWIVEKLFLEAGAIAYFFGVIITSLVTDWIFKMVLSFIISLII